MFWTQIWRELIHQHQILIDHHLEDSQSFGFVYPSLQLGGAIQGGRQRLPEETHQPSGDPLTNITIILHASPHVLIHETAELVFVDPILVLVSMKNLSWRSGDKVMLVTLTWHDLMGGFSGWEYISGFVLAHKADIFTVSPCPTPFGYPEH